ncbi:MAG: NAD/NADP octopine/nopaline dehydrogenase family protein [Syntrophothermus sp.]
MKNHILTPLSFIRRRKHSYYHPERPAFAVIGAGNGGQAMAAYLALKGHRVTLFNRSRPTLEKIGKRGGITLEGVLTGFARGLELTDDPARAVHGADIVMVTTPAFAHRKLAASLAPHLVDGQIVVLNPGRTLGTVEFECELRANGCLADVTVAEAQSLLYACRAVEPGLVKVFSIKRSVPLAAFPAERTGEVLEAINHIFPQFVPAPSVLHTGLGNIGAVFHPAPVILNAGRIESGQPFEHYREGITPGVATVLEALDAERLEVAQAYGMNLPSAREWLGETYGATGDTLYAALQATEAYRGLSAPGDFQTRYLREDVPASLVPIASLGREAGVATPVIDSIIMLASSLVKVDFWASGRTLDSLGLDGLGVQGVLEVLANREKPEGGWRNENTWSSHWRMRARCRRIQLFEAGRGSEV